MTRRRSDTVVDQESDYHCIARCVRRAFLCGEDSHSGKNFDYRKDWVRDRLLFLITVFTIEALAYALMDNHLHVMLRTRPDLLGSLSDREVARRWLLLYPPRHKSEASDDDIDMLAKDKKRIRLLRKRLGSVSWFMKSLNEFIAVKANREDCCKGRFWEGRFKCQRLCGEAALLTCSMYIDLNLIRANKAPTPERSEFTSAYERIELLKQNKTETGLWLTPIQSTKTRRGFLSMSREEYLSLLDATGRVVKKGKRGSIPSDLESILTRLGIKPAGWAGAVEDLGNCFSIMVGNQDCLRQKAVALGRKWLKGARMAQRVFA